jgi:hypothetical protein
MHSFFYSSSNRLLYFFDPRMVRTLGSLARTTVAPREFRQIRLCRPHVHRPSQAPLTHYVTDGCAVSGHDRSRPRPASSQNNHIVCRDERARCDRHRQQSQTRACLGTSDSCDCDSQICERLESGLPLHDLPSFPATPVQIPCVVHSRNHAIQDALLRWGPNFGHTACVSGDCRGFTR